MTRPTAGPTTGAVPQPRDEVRHRALRPPRGGRGVPVALALTGIAGMLLGPFLPWIISGRVSRNAYQIFGVAGRLGVIDGGDAMAVLVALAGPVCLAPVMLAALRCWRVAAALAITVSLAYIAAVIAALTAIAQVADLGIRPGYLGPAVTALGAVLAGVASAVAAHGQPPAHHRARDDRRPRHRGPADRL